MLALAQWRGQAWPTRREWVGCALIGILMAFAAMALVVLAQHQGIGSGLMATVVTTMPMWLALWTRLGGERVPGTSWAGLALGAVGAGLLALEGDFGATPLGALFAFAAPLCWSIGSYASRRPQRRSVAASARGLQRQQCAVALGQKAFALLQHEVPKRLRRGRQQLGQRVHHMPGAHHGRALNV